MCLCTQVPEGDPITDQQLVDQLEILAKASAGAGAGAGAEETSVSPLACTYRVPMSIGSPHVELDRGLPTFSQILPHSAPFYWVPLLLSRVHCCALHATTLHLLLIDTTREVSVERTQPPPQPFNPACVLCVRVCVCMRVAQKGCVVFDVVINASMLERTKGSELWLGFIMTLILEGIETKHNCSLSRGS